QVLLAGEAHGHGDVVGAGAAGDQGRAPVDGAVPDPAGLVVALLPRPQQGPGEAGAQPGEPAHHSRASFRNASRVVGVVVSAVRATFANGQPRFMASCMSTISEATSSDMPAPARAGLTPSGGNWTYGRSGMPTRSPIARVAAAMVTSSVPSS